MKVSILTEDKYLVYEAFLKHHKAALIYYSIKFKQFLEKQTKSESIIFLAIDENDNIQGILPLMVKTGPFGKVLNSLPYYGSNGGILANLKEAKDLLIDKYLEIANSGEYAAATIIENPLDKDYPYDKIISDETEFRIGQLTNIAGSFADLEELMVRFDSKTRNIIRKAIKSEVIVKIDNDQFDFLRNTHLKNMELIGGLAKELIFFDNVQKYFTSGVDYNLYVARIDNVLVAATLVFYYGKVVEYYTPVIVKEFRSFQPLSYIIAKAMFDASTNGYQWWNWGGTWASQDGVHNFKSKWGTEEKKYSYHIFVFNKELYNCTKDDLLNQYSGFYVLPFSSLKS